MLKHKKIEKRKKDQYEMTMPHKIGYVEKMDSGTFN
jgi:hypothetical protein